MDQYIYMPLYEIDGYICNGCADYLVSIGYARMRGTDSDLLDPI